MAIAPGPGDPGPSRSWSAGLNQIGLGGLIFDLHKQQLKRRDVAQQLQLTLKTAGREPVADSDGLYARLMATRQSVTDHAIRMNTPVEPWQLSPYQLSSRLLGNADLEARSVKLRGAVLERVNGETVTAIQDDLRSYLHAGGMRVRRKESPWVDARVKDEGDVQKILARLDELDGGVLTDSQRDLDEIVLRTRLQRPGSVKEWRELLAFLDAVGRTTQEFSEAIFGADLDDLVVATSPWRSPLRQQRAQSLLQRRRFRKQASRSGQTRGPLHQSLVEARRQRDLWTALSGGSSSPCQVGNLETLLEQFVQIRDSLAAVGVCLQVADLEEQSVTDLDQRVQELAADRSTAYQITEINRRNRSLEGYGLRGLLDHLAQREADRGRPIGADEAVTAFESMWLSSLAEEYSHRMPVLHKFIGSRHDEIATEFKRSDAEHLKMNARRVRRKVAERLRAVQDENPEQSQVVSREANKKSRHIALRELMGKAPDVLLAAHPCWAMSPLVVSKMLPSERLFDLVIFDEASQVEPHDAVTSIMRGKQLVIAGDPHQLPPNRLFRLLEGEPIGDTEIEDDLKDYESILDVLSPVLPDHRLRWHYRSRDERLIAFSNKEIYSGDLVTFAGCRQESPIHLDVVDGVAAPGSGGVASAEVTRVVELVKQHALLHPDESIGIITFGSKQADAIEGALRQARNDDSDLQEYVERHDAPGQRIFVKNLERVQGDERDAIILSVGRPRSATGRVSMQFGTLGHEGGERRLNVAITRAKERLTVVSSFHPSEMTPGSSKNRGPELLRQFLEYASGENLLDVIGKPLASAELNGFEKSVLSALRERGVDVHPQWGVGEYAIDFALAHPTRPGEMVLAVEADGGRATSNVSPAASATRSSMTKARKPPKRFE